MWTSGSLLRGTNHHRFSHMTIKHVYIQGKEKCAQFHIISASVSVTLAYCLPSQSLCSALIGQLKRDCSYCNQHYMRAAHYSFKTLKQIFLISWHKRASVTSAALRIRLRADVFEPQLVVLKVSRPRFVCVFVKVWNISRKMQKTRKESADNVISISSSSSAISERRTSTHLYKRTYTSCSIKTLK